jgi:hypothetical protein
MKAICIAMILGTLAVGCTQQGGMGGGGKGADQQKGYETGTGRESNTNVSENTGNPKGTVTPRGTPSSSTADGSK